MANKFLDKTGLSTLWTKIKSLLSGKLDKTTNPVVDAKVTLVSAGNKITAKYYDGTTKDLVTVPTRLSSLSNDTSFVTKNYADSTYLPKSGGTITGDINMNLMKGIKHTDANVTSGFGFADDGWPVIVNTNARAINISNSTLDDYNAYTFPEYSGEVLVKDEYHNVKIKNDAGDDAYLKLSADDTGIGPHPYMELYTYGNSTYYHNDNITQDTSDGVYKIRFPKKSGTIALLEDLKNLGGSGSSTSSGTVDSFLWEFPLGGEYQELDVGVYKSVEVELICDSSLYYGDIIIPNHDYEVEFIIGHNEECVESVTMESGTTALKIIIECENGFFRIMRNGVAYSQRGLWEDGCISYFGCSVISGEGEGEGDGTSKTIKFLVKGVVA